MNRPKTAGEGDMIKIGGLMSADRIGGPCQVEKRHEMDGNGLRAATNLTVTSPDQLALQGLVKE